LVVDTPVRTRVEDSDVNVGSDRQLALSWVEAHEPRPVGRDEFYEAILA
jgi:hypothetical protein